MYNQRIDIHSLTLPLETAPKGTRQVEGIKNNILQARINAFTTSTKEFCSFIDPNDEILIPSIFDEAVEYLDNNPTIQGVYTNSLMCMKQGSQKLLEDHVWSKEYQANVGLPIHQLAIMRTTAIQQACKELTLHTEFAPEQLLYAHIQPWFFINKVAYKWNRTPDGASNTAHSKETIDLAKKYRKTVLFDK